MERSSYSNKKGDILNKPIAIRNIYRPPKENNEHYIEFIMNCL